MSAGCAAFERWLDEGRPGAGDAEARAHAADCARCASLLALEEALAAPASAPTAPDFTDRVMARVREDAPARARRAGPALFPTPVWAQALLDPLVALSLTALALLALGRDALWALGGALAAGWGALQWPALRLPALPGLPGAARAAQALAADPVVLAAVVLALAPALLLVSWPLYRWMERAAMGGWPRVALPRAGERAGGR